MKKVAIINSSDEIVEALCLALNNDGYHAIGAHLYDFKMGKVDYVEFLTKEKPDAILLDIAPPYEENWNFYQTMKSVDMAKDIPFVLTTTNEQILRKIIGKDIDVVEILGKPFDLELAVRKVEKAITTRSTNKPK